MTLAKKNRLTGSRDFKRVQESGDLRQYGSFGIAFYNRKDNEPSRFGFIVSTKISKDAVDRNRFKRTMSEAVRISTVDLNNGFDVVFLAKQSMPRVPTSEVMKEVRVALKESGLLK